MSWRFQLCETGSGPEPVGALISEVFGARDKQLELILNRPGSCRFNLSLRDPIAAAIAEGTTCIVAWREGNDDVQRERWSGPVWSVDENVADGTMSVSAVGWFEQLNKRLIRLDQAPLAIYSNQQGGAIVLGGGGSTVTGANSLLGLANTQKDTNGIARPTNISAGAFDPTPLDRLRTRTYQAYQSIGQAIQELSDVEAGFDFTIHPYTRVLNIHYQPIKEGSTLMGYGRDRPNTLFTLGWGPSNLAGLSLGSELGSLANRVNVTGKFTSGVAEDTPSVARYGFHEEQVALSDVVDDKILGAYAVSEIAVRAWPRPTFSLTPFPWSPEISVPRLFDDYDLGDIVYLRAVGGRETIGATPPGQALRVFGVQISIDNEGREQVTSIQTAPSS